MAEKIPRALTIAGSDSGGGAGIQADLKTFTALGVYGLSVLTSVTAQNTLEVSAIHDLPEQFVGLQFDAVMSDIGCDAAKLGMLSNEKIIETVAEKIDQYGIEKLVVDPVMRSKGGTALLRNSTELLKKRDSTKGPCSYSEHTRGGNTEFCKHKQRKRHEDRSRKDPLAWSKECSRKRGTSSERLSRGGYFFRRGDI